MSNNTTHQSNGIRIVLLAVAVCLSFGLLIGPSLLSRRAHRQAPNPKPSPSAHIAIGRPPALTKVSLCNNNWAFRGGLFTIAPPDDPQNAITLFASYRDCTSNLLPFALREDTRYPVTARLKNGLRVRFTAEVRSCWSAEWCKDDEKILNLQPFVEKGPLAYKLASRGSCNPAKSVRTGCKFVHSDGKVIRPAASHLPLSLNPSMGPFTINLAAPAASPPPTVSPGAVFRCIFPEDTI